MITYLIEKRKFTPYKVIKYNVRFFIFHTFNIEKKSMSLLFTNIKELLQIRDNHVSVVDGAVMKQLPSIKNAFLYIENDIIKDFGPNNQAEKYSAKTIIDASGKIVLPTWCDSHTHIV